MTRPPPELMDRLLQLAKTHGTSVSVRWIDNHGDAYMTEINLSEYLADEVRALRIELQETRAALINEASKHLPTPEEVQRFNQLMTEATLELIELRAALQRDIQKHKDAGN